MFIATLLLSASLRAIAAKLPDTVGGDFNITGPQLYPEKCAYDPKRHVLYCSELYESTVAVIDLEKKVIDRTIEFPGLSGLADYHASGLVRHGDDRLLVSINTGAAFETSGANITGTNFLIIYDLASNNAKTAEIARVDLTAVTNGTYGGVQDFTTDTFGNIFVVATYPGAILKVTPSFQVTDWFLSGDTNSTETGFTGIASNDNMLLSVTQQRDGRLVRFNSRDTKGQPFDVPIGKNETLGENLDGITLPAKYNHTILLVTSSQAGTTVLQSKDGKWDSAEKLGTVPNPHWRPGPPDQGFSSATYEQGERIYAVFEWFTDPRNSNGLSGPRTAFPFQDITSAVDTLVQSNLVNSRFGFGDPKRCGDE